MLELHIAVLGAENYNLYEYMSIVKHFRPGRDPIQTIVIASTLCLRYGYLTELLESNIPEVYTVFSSSQFSPDYTAQFPQVLLGKD